MGDNASRRGASNLGMPLMIVAFLAMIGFFYWLNLQAQQEKASDAEAIEEQAAAPESEEEAGAVTIQASNIQMDAAPYEGQTVRLEGMPVASGLGTQGFWIEMPNKNPFLVSMTEAVQAEGVQVQPGQTVTVTGAILPMNDSVLNAWSEAGSIGEGDRLAAEFATHYLDAVRVRVVEGGGSGNGQD